MDPRIPSIIAAVERAPAIIVPLVREVPADRVKRRPKPGKWSAHEHACHRAEVHPLFFERLDLLLREDRPRIRPCDPATAHPEDHLLQLDLEECRGRFERDRARRAERLKALGPADLERTADHPEYDRYSVLVIFRHLALHDLLHAYRIEEILLAREGGTSNLPVDRGPSASL